MNTTKANQRWMKTIVCGVSKMLRNELNRFGGINLPNIRGQVSETCPALSPAVMPPYKIWTISRINEVKASFDGSDHLAFLSWLRKPNLCPSAVHKERPNNASASSKWIVRLKWLTEGR